MREVELFRVEVPDVEPLPWPRARTNRSGKHYLPRPYVAYRDLLAMHLLAAYRKQAGRTVPTTDPIRLSVAFYRCSRRKADLDNLAKAVMDAGNGVVWLDDDQVERLVAGRDHVEREPRVEVIAYARLDEGATLSPTDPQGPAEESS